jgi:hypothetical protein
MRRIEDSLGAWYTRVMRAIALATMILAAGCNPTIDFAVPIESQTTIAGGGLLPDLLNAFGVGDLASLDLEASREFENNDVRKEQVVAARLTLLRLSIVEGSDNFDFLDSLSFSVAAPELPKERVASKTVANGVATFDCDIDELELAPYVRAPSLELSSAVEGRQPADDTTIKIELNFDIKAEVIGGGG